MKATYKNIKVTIHSNIAVLSFNRPEQLNAMNRDMMNEIIDGINNINEDDSVVVAIIRGEGRAFMAGADIKEYGGQTPEQFKSFQDCGIQLYKSIEKSTKPWIAAVKGFALGGGFEIALSCDMILASENVKMGLPEVFLSLVPGGGGTQRLIQKIGLNRAKEMLFFGNQYEADKLYKWGIVNEIYTQNEFDDKVMKFAEKLARRSPSAVKELKRLAQLSLEPVAFDEKLKEEGKVVTNLFYGEEAKKAIQKFIDKT